LGPQARPLPHPLVRDPLRPVLLLLPAPLFRVWCQQDQQRRQHK
jgi:hypothetical protein